MSWQPSDARQPDILEVIADLSNDEVRTPPRIADAMLDLLPDEVWRDPTLRWLDPGCKTGVFPRQITRRLMDGLVDVLPNRQERLDHILREQVFAVAITTITSMMSRRTVYCSKDASSEFSVVRMPKPDGSIWFDRVEHSYDQRGKCKECGAAKSQIERPGFDNHAYAFIHEDGRTALNEEFGMKFDVVVGNPPYQMDSDGNTRTMPIYHRFIEQALEMDPQYILMITPSRWFAGGLGLDDFRAKMLADRRISHLVDFPKSKDCFAGVKIRGGVSYFLWDKDHDGDCLVQTRRGSETEDPMLRPLNIYDVFVRNNRGVRILEKVLAATEKTMDEQVSSLVPFGIRAKFRDYVDSDRDDAVTLHVMSRKTEVISRGSVSAGVEMVDKHKTLIHAAYGEDNDGPYSVVANPFVASPNSACTETYLVLGAFDTAEEAEHLAGYVRTRLVRFLIWLRMNTQHLSKDRFRFVPVLPMNREWTDEELFAKFGITGDEQAYIAEVIKEMTS